MSLSGTSWSGKGPVWGISIPSVTSGRPPVTITTANGYSFQITANGAGIFPTQVGTPPKSQSDLMKEKIEAFDRAMRGVG